GILSASLAHCKIRAFQMYSQKLCSVDLPSLYPFVAFQRFDQSLLRSRQCSGDQRGGAVSGMSNSYLLKCLFCTIHKIVSPTTMHMDINKTRRQIFLLKINQNTISKTLQINIFVFIDRLDLCSFHENSTRKNPVFQYNSRVIK